MASNFTIYFTLEPRLQSIRSILVVTRTCVTTERVLWPGRLVRVAKVCVLWTSLESSTKEVRESLQMPTAHARAVKSIEKLLRPSALRFVRFTHTESERQKRRVCVLMSCSGAARGEGGKLTSNGWTSKNYVICVCSFHCHGTSSYHTTNTLQGRRAKSHVDTQTIQPGLGDFLL